MDEDTERQIQKEIRNYFYKFLVTMVATILLTFGGGLLATHDSIRSNTDDIGHITEAQARYLAREERLNEQLTALSRTVSRLTAETESLRRDYERL